MTSLSLLAGRTVLLHIICTVQSNSREVLVPYRRKKANGHTLPNNKYRGGGEFKTRFIIYTTANGLHQYSMTKNSTTLMP